MALMKCPECGKEISDQAPVCPNCGCPVNAGAQEKTPQPSRAHAPQDAQTNIAPPTSRPGRGAAIASLVLGIIGVALFWAIHLATILGLIGVCMAIVAKKSGFKGGIGTAGLVLSLIALLVGGSLWIRSIFFVREVMNNTDWNGLLDILGR
ncbi:MAG: zinc-ribbon domain-containing protein [Lachnospiraceae bacterium]|nr:zinc-ribbon domain-containing protein [Lachnospiraceae bacterium]